MTVGFSPDFAGYSLEAAHPYNGTDPLLYPLFCGGSERRFIFLDSTSLQGGLLHIDLTLTAPLVSSDCQGGTGSEAGLNSCTEGPSGLPAATIGRVYTKVGPCSGSAATADLRTSAWSLAGAPDAQGHVALTLANPGPSQCVFVGATYRFSGQEIPAIAGFIPIPGDTFCSDGDSDGWTGCEGDCNDSDPQSFPGHFEICDGHDNDCDDISDEGFGQTTCGVGACVRTVQDCVLGVPQACVPGTPSAETCDAVDNDCNGVADDGDADQDGYTICVDCNDQAASVHPGMAEVCDGVDQDCDTAVDEGLGSISCGTGACTRVVPACVGGALQSCIPGNPSQETCDGIDNDCNGFIDERDADGDGYALCADCNEASAAIHPGAPELCNAIDDDCDGLQDDFNNAADGDGDGVAGACDNCPVASNPSQVDSDLDGRGNSCDNCLFIANPGQTDVDGDQRGDVCDNCPTEFNSFQDDSDADSRGDVCDNCPFAANADQGNVDGDAEGNVCDLNDGLILITVPDDFFVEWQRESGFPSFNLYRGSLAVLRQTGVYTQNPATVPLAAKTCGTRDAYSLDGVAVSPGESVFYLVTGNGPGGESSLGTNSAGQPRPNTNPCP